MKRDNTYLIGNKFAVGSKPNKTTFKKGLIPWNKNKKGLHLSVKSQFKKGMIALNKLPIGSKTIRQHKQDKKRYWIKIDEPNKWIELSKFAWCSANGIIPKGFVVHHIDGDSLNDSLDNLTVLSRRAHLLIHGIGVAGRKNLASKVAARRLSQEVLDFS